MCREEPSCKNRTAAASVEVVSTSIVDAAKEFVGEV
jgi:hypothetical protein